MTPIRMLILALIFAAHVAVGRAEEKSSPPGPESAHIRPGLTGDEVRKLLGPPKRISRQILYRRYLEQWLYDVPSQLWIEFNCLKGQEPYVLTVHPAGAKKP